METILKSKNMTVVVSPQRPTVLIGEKISAAARNDLADALRDGDPGLLLEEARDQAAAGADVLEVNVAAPGVDQMVWLPQSVQAILESVDIPISIDTTDFDALASALATHQEVAPHGKPLINSVNGQERYLRGILPLAAEYGAAVIGMLLDDGNGDRQRIPQTAAGRLAVARKIVERAEAAGVPREDVVIDCMALSVSTDPQAGRVTLEAIRRVREELGLNMTLGPSNVSFGLPERKNLNWAFMAMAIQNGVNCPIVNVSRDRPFLLALDLLLGRDPYAERYIAAYREPGRQA